MFRPNVYITMLVGLGLLAGSGPGQVTTGRILGMVLDPSGATVGAAAVAVRNLETNATQKTSTDTEGRFLLPQLPAGSYEVTIEKEGFTSYVQGPIVLRLNQDADLHVRLELAGVAETLVVREDAPLINTTDAEVGVNFDTKRISELPVATNRNVLNLALSAAGVSQLQTGQGGVPLGGGTIAVNGMRVRSNERGRSAFDRPHRFVTNGVWELPSPDGWLGRTRGIASVQVSLC